MKRLATLGIGLALLWAMAAHAADTVYYIHTDALGSPVAMTDANRNVVERTQYAPYGQVLNRPEHDGPGYTGHEEDSATGLTNMQQRYDDKVIGRFLSVDPVQPDGNTGGSFNRYAYANDNPYKFTDPDGRFADWIPEDVNRGVACNFRPECEFGLATGSQQDKTRKQSSSQAMNSYFDAASHGNWGAALKAGISFISASWREAYSMPGSAMLTTMSMVPVVGIEASDLRVGYRSFSAFKRAEGAAGKGMQWHHIVEQTPGNVARFGPEAIHSTSNVVRLDVATHRQISAFYSTKPLGSDMTLRQILGAQSFEEQYNFGQQTLQDFGGGQ